MQYIERQPIFDLLQTKADKTRRLENYETDWWTVFENALLGKPLHAELSSPSGVQNQSETSTAIDEVNGVGGDLSKTKNQSSTPWAQSLSLPASRQNHW